MKPISATSGLGHPHSPPYPARALSSRAFGPRPSFRPFHSRRIILGLRPIRSLDAHRFVWSLARHNTTPRLPGRRVLSLHYAYSPGPSIYSPQRLHPCGLSRPCDLAYQHTYTLLSVLRTCHARALLPDARSPRFGLSSPGTNNIIYPASALSLKKRAAMIHVILSLIIHTCCASPARHFHSTHSICSCLACSCARRAASLPSLRDAVQSHSGSDPYYSPLRLDAWLHTRRSFDH